MTYAKQNYNKHLSVFLLFFILFTFNTHTQARTKITDAIVSETHKQSHVLASNNIYLQTNKGIYETEEDLWFKAYVLDAKTLSPSFLDKTLFIQLIEDCTNQTVIEEKYEIENGFVTGHIFLNDSLKNGTYSLIAFSANTIKTNTKNYHAIRKIQLLKTIKEKSINHQTLKDSLIHFSIFPESGNLVYSIPNRVAFKAVNTNGEPVDISGSLYENNTLVFNFKSQYAGMGSFIFSTNPNKTYHIKLEKPYDNQTYSLPKIYNNATSLQLIGDRNEYLIFKVNRTENLNKETVYLSAQLRGTVYNIAVGDLETELIFKIPINDIPQGIAEFTLFNSELKPLAERLVYVNP
ncbi:hypothetical protein, partial [Aestuariibaculum marinum]